MQKKMILVGLANRSLGWEFFKAVTDSLEKRSIKLTQIDCVRLRFETPHTKTWFVFPSDPNHMLQGIRADAVFGSGYRWLVAPYAKPDAVFAKRDGIGLVEYICQVEKEAEKMYRTTTDMCVADMYPPTLFMKPLSEQEKKLYRHILNATYGKYGTFSSKPRKLDPALFNTVEIKPLASDKNLDGLRKLYPIDEWDSYKDTVLMGTWPKTNPYLMSKGDVERIFQEGSKQFVDQQLIYALGRGNGKSTMCLKHLEKEFEKKEGEKIMDAVTKDLIMNKNAQLTTAHGTVPVRIDELEIKTCRDTGREVYFEGHMLYPDLNDIINWRVDTLMNKPTKLPGIKNVIFSGPCTIVLWEDGTKTVVRCNNVYHVRGSKTLEKFDPEKGLAMAIAKKALGTNESGSNYYDIFKKWLPEDKAEPKKKKTTKGDKQNG
jgi:hypothetical protein